MKLKFLPILLTIVILAVGCSGKPSGYHKIEGMIWNTVYHVTYDGPEELEDSILPVLNEVGRSLSVFEDSSLVSQLNRSKEVKADRHLAKVYDMSERIHRLSGGNFDPTVSPLIDAWGFGLGHIPNADTLAVDSVLKFVGFGKTRHVGDLIIKDDIRTRFNFSAIAKGYGSDAVGEMLKRNGVGNFMVEIGGEIILSGKSPSGKAWRVGIDVPEDDSNPGESSAMVISLTDAAVATSGNYRNYRMEGGEKLAHTISPVTGRPFVSPILSATVIAPTCMEADALATACMAGKPEEAFQLLELAGAEGLLIFEDSVAITKGFPKEL